jgi:ribosomal protein L14E/L6E/L27E
MTEEGAAVPEQMSQEEKDTATPATPGGISGGRRRRSNGSHKNSWLSHVKATMKANPNKSFKQVLKIAKKTYKRSQSQSKSQSKSQSQNGGRRSRGRKYGKKRGGNAHAQDMFQETQKGGSGMAGKPAFGSNAESL